MSVNGFDHVVVNVSDVERSITWYTEMLGLRAERVDEWRAGSVPFPSVRIDSATVIDLMALDRTGTNIDHFCLVADRADVDAVAVDPRFDVVDGPAQRWGAKGVGWSVYVTDPDGNVIELRSYG